MVLVAGLVGLALRVARLIEAPATDPMYGVFLLDSAFYDDMAREILARGPVLDGPFPMAPLYGYFLAALYAVRGALGLGEGPGLVFAVQAALGAGTAALAAALGGRLGGRIGAWTAGLAVALYPVGVLYDAQLLSVTLATFLATLGTCGALKLWDDPGASGGRPGLALLTGLSLGLATTARGNLLLALPPLLLLLAWRGWRTRAGRVALLLVALGMAAPLGLSFAHNAANGAPAAVSVNGGINLYRGNNPYFVDVAVEPFRLPAERDALARRSLLVASIASDRWLDAREADQYWVDRAVAHWRSDPVRYAALFLRKTVQVLGWDEIPDNVDHEHLLARSRVLGWIPPLYGPLVALGLVGLYLRRREFAPLVLLLATGVGSVALFFVVARYRLPLVPLWAAYAGAALAALVEASRAGRRSHALGLGASAALLTALLALPATSKLWPWSWLIPETPIAACTIDVHRLRAPEVEDAYRRAFHALLAGRNAEAEAALRDLVQVDPGHTPTGVTLSYLLLQRGDTRAASLEAARVIEIDPCEEKAWTNLGNALLSEGRVQGALGALHKASELDPYDPEVRAALGAAWLAASNREKAREALTFAVRWDPEGWKARGLLARVELRDKRPDEAARLLDEALLLAPDQADLWALRGLAALGLGDLEGAEAALLQGEATQAKNPAAKPDPILSALRKALDQPFKLPEDARLTVRQGVGP